MTWTYRQENGALEHDGEHVGHGYSGQQGSTPGQEAVRGVGPIPRGSWRIEGPPRDSEAHGPFVLRLSPAPGTVTYGRGGFLMHGDCLSAPGTASRGCIVLPPGLRRLIWDSGDRSLEVA